MNVPALIGLDYDEGMDGKKAIVDGFKGTLIVEPDEDVLAQYEEMAAKEEAKHRKEQKTKTKKRLKRS